MVASLLANIRRSDEWTDSKRPVADISILLDPYLKLKVLRMYVNCREEVQNSSIFCVLIFLMRRLQLSAMASQGKDEMLFWLVGWTYETVLISLIKPIWHTDCTPNCCNSDIF